MALLPPSTTSPREEEEPVLGPWIVIKQTSKTRVTSFRIGPSDGAQGFLDPLNSEAKFAQKFMKVCIVFFSDIFCEAPAGETGASIFTTREGRW